MSTLTDEVYVKLGEKYPKEKLEYIYNNFFLLIRELIKSKLAASIYISNFGAFFLSANMIKHKIKRYERMELDTTELKELLEVSKNYNINADSHQRKSKRNSV